MNTTRVPGFSAEASLYPSSAHYQVRQMSAAPREGRKGVVHLAMIRPVEWFCEDTFCCLVGEGWHMCFGRMSRPTR